ncbi:MarR family winged helix-turn-helix transcriptional regulator [Actinoplanes utahensis]|uniref:Uncharacterized protein n=1 Tax=Actinoplanes utahensis TaxID=1869 RepID=A0A0A6X9H3_ACTUT|nr:MarR family winged helix-turn-helix transcriptional regulator [Actinoplanes utahensis]KHD76757.1 hypothetical protein MB27_15860 [Actinoplanes utahensis]GIF33174.1 hypothetical protein Aut01nite_61600 [Actinoplanes utahensis]
MTEAAHLPMREVIRRAGALSDVRPVRFVPLLLPMWAVEVVATVREASSYDVFDRYLTRALAEAGLSGIGELAAFFGVEPALVERAARFLETIGHVRRESGALVLTDLGRRSNADGRRYVLSPGRRLTLRFDGGVARPVPYPHTTHSGWLPAPALTLPDGTVFTAVGEPSPLPAGAVEQLLSRADVEEFTGPAVPVEVAEPAPRPVWLPVYLVECEGDPVVFGWAVDGPDPYLLQVYRDCAGEPESHLPQCGDHHGP